jgi:antitoxin CcdA
MTANFYNPSAPKKAANVSINSEILALAKEYKINLSRALEEKVAEMLRQKEAAKWEKENRVAIEEYNERIRKNGTFSDSFRSF